MNQASSPDLATKTKSLLGWKRLRYIVAYLYNLSVFANVIQQILLSLLERPKANGAEERASSQFEVDKGIIT